MNFFAVVQNYFKVTQSGEYEKYFNTIHIHLKLYF
jgi:hypothetical protein